MTQSESPLLLAIMGPTAAGKTSLAEGLAPQLGAQLINADAFQVYRGFDIGTAKSDRPEQYLLIDHKEPHEQYGVGEYVLEASAALRRLWSDGKGAIIVGGTGFYIRALLEQYGDMQGPPADEIRRELEEQERTEGLASLLLRLQSVAPEAYEKVDRSNPVRVRRALERVLSDAPPVRFDVPPFQVVKVGLSFPPEALNIRIENRFRDMMQNGWKEEVVQLRARGVKYDWPAMRAIGYRPMWDWLEGKIGEAAAMERILTDMRQYAKRQRSWLRKEPRLNEVNAETGQVPEQVLRLIAR